VKINARMIRPQPPNLPRIHTSRPGRSPSVSCKNHDFRTK
jgi:hypothetical protein